MPLELLEMCNLVGPESYVRERIEAFARGGRDQPAGHAGPGRRRRPGRPGRADEGVGRHDRRRRPSDRSSRRSTRRSAVPSASFIEKEVTPHHEQWEADGQVSREVWTRAGEQGLLCFDVDEEYGGPGVSDFRYNLVLAEEMTRAGAHGPGFPVHTDIIVPYLSQPRDRRAEAALAARLRQRRDDHRDRDDRARRRQRPAGHPHERRRQGRPLRAATAARPSSATARWPTW